MTQETAPRDFSTLKALIVTRAADLPKRLAQVATFAVENPDEMAFGTVASIAERADVQPSALIRFSQTLGYEGFSDLQDVFRNRLRERVLNYDERLEQLRGHAKGGSNAALIFEGFSDSSARSIAVLRDKLDPDQLEWAVDMLASADTIFLVGLRRSFPITSYMSYALGKLNVRNTLIDAVGGLADEVISFASHKDCILAISFTPYASETVVLAQQGVQRNVPMVAITDSPFSPLVPLAKIWFEVQEANFEGFRSVSASLALAMTLAVAVAERRKTLNTNLE
jgi:DNA-binding MurR/RpiR family transcriptional regulator